MKSKSKKRRKISATSERSGLYNKIYLLIVFLIIFYLLFNFRFWFWQADAADTAYFDEMTRSLSKWNWFGTHFAGSIGVYFKDGIGNPNIHKLNEIPGFPMNVQVNAFYNHAYLILIPVAALASIFDYRTTISALVVLATLIPFIMLPNSIQYNCARRNKPKLVVVGVLSILILVCFPGINALALGQFYPDRLIILFLPVAMVFIEKLSDGSNRRTNLIFIALAILCASVTERGSLYIALVSFSLLFFRLVKNRDHLKETLHSSISILFVSIAATAWTGIYVTRIARNQDTAGFIYSFTHFSFANSHVFSIPSLKMLILCLPLIFVVSKYADLLFISIIVILPNLLGTFGFSLKTGWLTHYMSYMTAALVGAFLLALRRDSQQELGHSAVDDKGLFISIRMVLAATLSVASVFLINPVTNLTLIEPTIQIRLGTFAHAAYWWLNQDYREHSQRTVTADYQLAGLVPWNSSVVATEPTAPLVSGRVKNVDYYPINLKNDEYVLIHSTAPAGQPFAAYPVVNYSSASASKELTTEVTKLLLSDCFEIVKRNTNSNLYLFHRIKTINTDTVCDSRVGRP